MPLLYSIFAYIYIHTLRKLRENLMTDPNIFNNIKASYHTLGCKLNFAETSTFGRALRERGVTEAAKGEEADICIINSCSVTDLADKKCRQLIRRLSRENPNAYIVVTGCYAQLSPEEIEKIEGVDLILGAAEKSIIVEKIEELFVSKGGVNSFVTKASDIKGFTPSCSRGDRTRYFLKVQDGCDYYCSYCTIPFARGRSRNGSIESLVKQAEGVAGEGGKEIVITGVNIGDFGKSTNETFFNLIKALDRVEGIERYRISSIEPNLLTDELIEYISTSKRIAPHFHIPLQSGSNRVLELMKRRYTKELFASKVNKIKEIMPNAFIGVDLIVGTRGEEDYLFEESFDTVKSLDISQLHVFTYSERPGTKALEIDHKVSSADKHTRCNRMIELSEERRLKFYNSQIDSVRSVLFEQPAKGVTIMHGFTDNYIRVEMPLDNSLINTVIKVKLGEITEDKTSLTVKNIVL